MNGRCRHESVRGDCCQFVEHVDVEQVAREGKAGKRAGQKQRQRLAAGGCRSTRPATAPAWSAVREREQQCGVVDVKVIPIGGAEAAERDCVGAS